MPVYQPPRRGQMMPFGMPTQGEQQPYYQMPWQQTGIVGGFQNPFAGFLSHMLGQTQQKAAPKPVTIDKMPKDMRALTSMSQGRTMDPDGFLGGIFGPTGKAK